MARIALGVVATLVVLLGGASHASAAPTVSRLFDSDGTTGFMFADASSTANTVFLDKGSAAETLEFHSVIGGDITLSPGAMTAGCTQPTSASVRCPRVVGGRVMQMQVDTGPMDDAVSTGSALPVGVVLLGGAGADTLTGGPGDDLITPGAGLDFPDGGAGRDTISFNDGRATGIAMNLGPGGTTVDGGEDDVNFERVIGSPFDDVIVGDAGDNDLLGMDGGDHLDGFTGNDLIDGGVGDDTSLVGDSGNDVILGGAGVTSTVDGGAGNDTFSYEDHITGMTASLAGSLEDVTSHSGLENLRGGLGVDELTGDGGPNTLEGLGGADSLHGGAGDDLMIGGPGADSFDGGGDSDTASYRERATPVTIDFGATSSSADDVRPDGDSFTEVEVFEGGPGPDVFRGNDNLAEAFIGGQGDDRFRGGLGADSFTGGPGVDTVEYDDAARTGAVTVSLTAGSTTGGDGDVLVDPIENATGGPGDDTLIGNDAANVLLGLGGADSLSGAGGADTLESGPGNDNVDGGAGLDALRLGEGDDGYATADGEADTVDCSTGTDFGSADAIDTLTACELPPPPPTPPSPATSHIGARIHHAFTVRSTFTRVRKLTVTSLPAGSSTRVTCKAARKDRRKTGKAAPCPFASRTKAVPSARAELKLAGLFEGRKLTPGTVLTVAVTAPGVIGRRVSYTMRAGKAPRRVLTCLPPGGKPEAC